MIASAHQPQYLPWLGYFHKIYHSDIFIFLDDVQYKEREYQNRNRIRTLKDWMWLTVPILKNGQSYPNISNVYIDNTQRWKQKHRRAMYLNYAKAPFFKKYSEFFEDLYKKEWNRLVDLNIYITKYILDSLQINKPIYFASQLKIETKNTRRIVDICRVLSIDTYLSGIGGKDYLEEELFDANGIKLIYQDFKHPEYIQHHAPFMPFMSIIDLLFNHGPDSLRILTGK
jgi:hypothetical protein